MVSSSPLITRLVDGVLTLSLNRPRQRNAIDAKLLEALDAALDAAATSGDVRAIVLTGTSGTFCSGGDLEGFSELQNPLVYRWVSHRLSAMIDGFERIEKPTVAVIDGPAVGAGVALALACDWRIGTPATRFSYREGAVGLVATHGGCARLVKLLGLARAREAMLGGEELDLGAAYRLGMISEIADAEPLLTVNARVQLMLKRSPLSYAAAKRVLALAADTDVRSAMIAESLAQTTLLASKDHQEGVNALRERRQPVFDGR